MHDLCRISLFTCRNGLVFKQSPKLLGSPAENSVRVVMKALGDYHPNKWWKVEKLKFFHHPSSRFNHHLFTLRTSHFTKVDFPVAEGPQWSPACYFSTTAGWESWTHQEVWHPDGNLQTGLRRQTITNVIACAKIQILWLYMIIDHKLYTYIYIYIYIYMLIIGDIYIYIWWS